MKRNERKMKVEWNFPRILAIKKEGTKRIVRNKGKENQRDL